MSAGNTRNDPHRSDAIRARWMALFFVLGSTCFVIAPLAPYAKLVGDTADEVTFFVGSILFTLAGATQSRLAWPERRQSRAGLAAWRTAWVQSVGTVAFNVTTFFAIGVSSSSHAYNRLVWRPDAAGSVCFLVSGAIGYYWLPSRGLVPQIRRAGWWEPVVNLLGCVLFGISAVAGYVVPSTGSVLDLAAANFTTSAGALCFALCSLPTLFSGRTFKVNRLQRLRELEHDVERKIVDVGDDIELEVEEVEVDIDRLS